MNFEEKPYLQEIALKRDKIDNYDKFPFCIPAIKELDVIEFHPTFRSHFRNKLPHKLYPIALEAEFDALEAL